MLQIIKNEQIVQFTTLLSVQQESALIKLAEIWSVEPSRVSKKQTALMLAKHFCDTNDSNPLYCQTIVKLREISI